MSENKVARLKAVVSSHMIYYFSGCTLFTSSCQIWDYSEPAWTFKNKIRKLFSFPPHQYEDPDIQEHQNICVWAGEKLYEYVNGVWLIPFSVAELFPKFITAHYQQNLIVITKFGKILNIIPSEDQVESICLGAIRPTIVKIYNSDIFAAFDKRLFWLNDGTKTEIKGIRQKILGIFRSPDEQFAIAWTEDAFFFIKYGRRTAAIRYSLNNSKGIKFCVESSENCFGDGGTPYMRPRRKNWYTFNMQKILECPPPNEKPGDCFRESQNLKNMDIISISQFRSNRVVTLRSGECVVIE